MAQALLFPDPKPLDQRLGRKFFREAPRRTGVYLMKNARDQVVYVGKAKDLKQRLNNYRLANPDRMPRRHLRMVREVARIEFQFCANEAAALERESQLLRRLRPRFNRAGVWPGRPRFLSWRLAGRRLELAVVEIPSAGWQRYGPLNSGAGWLHEALARLLWLACHGQCSVAELPLGWLRGGGITVAALECGGEAENLLALMNHYFWENSALFVAWLAGRLGERTHAFERSLIAADLETVQNFAVREREKARGFGRLSD